MASIIAAALAYIPYRVAGSDGYTRYRRMQKESANLASENDALRHENRALRRDIHGLRDDLIVIAQVARDELGMVGRDELVIQVPKPSGGSAVVSKAP